MESAWGQQLRVVAGSAPCPLSPHEVSRGLRAPCPAHLGPAAVPGRPPERSPARLRVEAGSARCHPCLASGHKSWLTRQWFVPPRGHAGGLLESSPSTRSGGFLLAIKCLSFGMIFFFFSFSNSPEANAALVELLSCVELAWRPQRHVVPGRWARCTGTAHPPGVESHHPVPGAGVQQ